MTFTDDALPLGRPVRGDIMRWNRMIAWVGFSLGIGTGLVMGLWSFDGPVSVPGWLGAYADTSRRLARLGHIALFGLGFLNLHLAARLSDCPLSSASKRLAARAMNFGNVGLPLTLFAAAAVPWFKYVLPVPALSVALAVTLATVGVVRGRGDGAHEDR